MAVHPLDPKRAFYHTRATWRLVKLNAIVDIWKSRVAALSESGRPEAAWPAGKRMRSSTKL